MVSDAYCAFGIERSFEQLWCSGRYLFHEASFCQRYRLRPPTIGIAVIKATLMQGESEERIGDRKINSKTGGNVEGTQALCMMDREA